MYDIVIVFYICVLDIELVSSINRPQEDRINVSLYSCVKIFFTHTMDCFFSLLLKAHLNKILIVFLQLVRLQKVYSYSDRLTTTYPCLDCLLNSDQMYCDLRCYNFLDVPLDAWQLASTKKRPSK